MDEKTAELRDIFVSVAGDEEVTETQQESRGSLREDEAAIEAELERLVSQMREELAFETDLEVEAYCRIVRGFFDGTPDTAMGESLGVDPATVRRARLDLHLLRGRETDPPFDLAELRRLLDGDRPVAAAAEALDVSPSTVRRYRRVVETRAEIRRVNDRYRSEFEELLTDADLADHTGRVAETGLRDATEDVETDVQF